MKTTNKRIDRVKLSIIPLNDLLCFYCNDLLINPRECNECESLYCEECETKLKEENKICQNEECKNNKNFSLIQPRKKWMKLYNSSTIKCENEFLGCTESFTIENLLAHTQNECLFRWIICEKEKCKAKIRVNSLQSHLTNECSERIVYCKNSGCSFKSANYELEKHYYDCRFFPLCSHTKECRTCENELKKLQYFGNQEIQSMAKEIKELNEYKKVVKYNYEGEITRLNDLLKVAQEELKFKLFENKKFLDEIEEKYSQILKAKDEEFKNKVDENKKLIIEIEEKHSQILKEKNIILDNLIDENKKLQNEIAEIKSKNIKIIPKQNNVGEFDIDFSAEHYTLSENNTKATWKNCSNNDLMYDYKYFPVARIAYLFQKNFTVKFKMNEYGWFGVGSTNIKNDGFPGYTPQGWMICSDGRLWHNNSCLMSFSAIKYNKEITFYCDISSKIIFVTCSSITSTYKTNFPDEVYFVISVKSGTNVKLLDN